MRLEYTEKPATLEEIIEAVSEATAKHQLAMLNLNDAAIKLERAISNMKAFTESSVGINGQAINKTVKSAKEASVAVKQSEMNPSLKLNVIKEMALLRDELSKKIGSNHFDTGTWFEFGFDPYSNCTVIIANAIDIDGEPAGLRLNKRKLVKL